MALNINCNPEEWILLTYREDHPLDKYEDSGVYMSSSVDCRKKKTVGQTGRSFHTRYKEHAQDYRLGNQKFNFAKHLLTVYRLMEAKFKSCSAPQ
jgi:hypothetical protein